MRYHPYHAPVPPPDRSPLQRAFSLSGLLPLGAFLVLHLWMNARALGGEGRFAAGVDALHGSPLFSFAEAAFVFAPLALHAALGLRLALTRVTFVDPSPYPPPVLAIMRGTGIVVAGFLVLHLFELRFRVVGGARPGGGELGTLLAAGLSSTRLGVPWRAVGYLVAVGCVAFHFAAGSWGFFARTRRGQERPRARRQAAWGAALVGVTLALGFADVVVFHATGARLVGGEGPGERPARPCP
jgi:succinate dehydrogenase / fumarate reductase cytochrome b subunit